jgi:phage terminase large subunit
MARPPRLHGKILSPVEKRALKQEFLERLARGEFIKDAAEAMTVPLETFNRWRRDDALFRNSWDRARTIGRADRDYTLPPMPTPPVLPEPAPLAGPPFDWAPRPHQQKLWRYLQDGGKRAVAVWHRRAGKDSLAINFAACAAQQRVANYWHMLPTTAQGRKVVWEGIDNQGRRIIDQAFPKRIRLGKLDDEMLLRLEGGSTWQVVGSDNFDRLVGANPAGVVFSEWALADPRAWDYLRPILAENGGWALFIYTPRGRNHGAEMFAMAQAAPGWFAERLTVEDTGIIGPERIAEERRSGMADELIRQEYFCSFQAALVGAYYGPQMEALERDGQITAVPYVPGIPVTTVWDLGIGDSTAIWFVQAAGREIRLIDYYENSGVGLDHYAGVLERKGYDYAETLLPHDANHREMSNGRTRIETLRALGVARARVLPLHGLEDGINAARVILPRCWFDKENCARGIEALRQYRRGWDDERKCFGERPLHDWSSHAADAFRYLALGLREPKRPGAPALTALTEDEQWPARDRRPHVITEDE